MVKCTVFIARIISINNNCRQHRLSYTTAEESVFQKLLLLRANKLLPYL